MSSSLIFLCILVNMLTFTSTVDIKHPNIVFILTDDQDVVLGGQTPMTKTKKLIGDAGVTFSNMFTTSPLCCPSRSSILTGNYVHNHNALNNSLSGNCSSPDWQQGPEKHAFSTFLKQQGYTTFFAGKYLNQDLSVKGLNIAKAGNLDFLMDGSTFSYAPCDCVLGSYGDHEAGGVSHVPPGWDHWYGLLGNSVYYDYTLSVNGKPEKHGNNYSADYLTDVINTRATDFLNSTAVESPFFMMLSTPACHAPFTPAPQYNATFSNESAPRDGSFNLAGKDKHWLISMAPNPMSNISVTFLDNTFRNRWRTLLSVDDMVEDVISLLTQKGILDNTYVFFSSDNGYHLGQFSLPNDKRQLYDFDLRVPLMVRGPGIKPGQVIQDVVLNIDFAPTFIDIAGKAPPKEMDGMSILPLLKQHADEGDGMPARAFLIEHWGEQTTTIPSCPQYQNQGMANCHPDCVCEDAWNNTFGCVQKLMQGTNMKYCIMSDNVNFVEMYDLLKDPSELLNVASTMDPKVVAYYDNMLAQLSVCSGDSCRKIGDKSLKAEFDNDFVEINEHDLLWSKDMFAVSDKETDHDPVVIHMDRKP